MQTEAGGFILPTTRRIRLVNDRPVRPAGRLVVYWMIAARRPAFNFALDRAVAWARELGLPLVVLEALRVDYPWASDRVHAFVLRGMSDNRHAFASSPALYYPYVEPTPGAGRGLLQALARDAAVVVTDDYPCFFLPRAVMAAGRRLPIRLEAVDSNGLIPMALADRAYTAAVHFRRFVQKQLIGQLSEWPGAKPFAGGKIPRLEGLERSLTRRWPAASDALLRGEPRALATLPIDHEVFAVPTPGGARAGARALRAFVDRRLATYHEAHNHPDDEGTSRLSPYLHFGHLAAHQVFDAVMRAERWSARRVAARPTGRREGWWGIRAGAEAFLDQLVVWRELGFNTCHRLPQTYAEFDALPSWALASLAAHGADRRPWVYSHEEFERADSHDALWNAAQGELRERGWVHNYMRMLWGKKILEWSKTPREALRTMIAIMDRWALDGRDPNSYAGYTWCLGRYDRPWPERPIYGKVRSMSSERTAGKVRVKAYLARFDAGGARVAVRSGSGKAKEKSPRG